MPRERTVRWHGLIGERGRRIAHAGSWSLVAKAATAANLFLSVPYVLGALGPARFGVWATLVSLIAFAGFLDFGIGNGVMNLVASAHGREDAGRVATILREARQTLAWVALALALPAAAAIAGVPWHRLFDMPASASGECMAAVAIVFGAILASVPLNMANRVQLGLGRGEMTFRWQAVGQLLALGCVVVASLAGAPLVVLVAAAVATPLVASAGNTMHMWHRLHASPTHAPPEERKAIRHAIRVEGLLFFVLQLAAALAFSADLPLISALRGAEDAGTYAIVQRLYSIIPLSLGLVWAPLWPIYRQALAAGNHDWVVRTLRHSLLLAAVVATSAALVLAFGFERIVSLWVHRPLAVATTLLAGFALWSVVDAIGTSLSTFFNAASIMRYQVIVAGIFAVTCLSAKVWAIGHFGMAAVPWVTVATYFTTSLLPTIVLGPRLVAMALAKDY